MNNEVQWPNYLVDLVQILLYWLFIRWLIANLASNGQPLGLSFAGSFWAYLGWNILFGLSILTIIGWAWVIAAWARWLCRNIQGTRRQVVYKGTGLENLWRTLVMAICCAFIIPIPWMYRWMLRWQLSQTELVERRRLSVRKRHCLRSRTEPSCATEATSVPSGLKIMPRVSPRPSCALGESWA